MFRQHRTEIVVQMRSQIFRQIVHKFRRHTDVCQGICVQDAGKDEGQMCHKAVRRSLCGVAFIKKSANRQKTVDKPEKA